MSACAPTIAKAQSPDTKTPTPNHFYDPTATFEPQFVQLSPTPDYDYLFKIYPTLTPMPETPTPIEPFLYFTQKIYGEELTDDGSLLSKVGCGITVGAMVTRTDPWVYYQSFKDYFKSIGKYGPARITKNGSSMEDHISVLESLGFNLENISDGKTSQEVKEKIKELTAAGIPVWVNANIYASGHHTMAVGINENGEIIFNDPFYGEEVAIPDKDILIINEKGETVWKVFAVYPPKD